jgi:hypothetical protein
MKILECFWVVARMLSQFLSEHLVGSLYEPNAELDTRKVNKIFEFSSEIP